MSDMAKTRREQTREIGEQIEAALKEARKYALGLREASSKALAGASELARVDPDSLIVQATQMGLCVNRVRELRDELVRLQSGG
jgi:hypothetical protein